jgi:ABC-type branched-subunit amino acid transport system substrate-binding protein
VALLRLIALHEAQGDAYRAAQEIKRFTATFPQHAALPQVEAITERMQKRAKSSRHRIGALFQTTGDSAAFSDSALKGIQLAVQHFRSQEGAVGLIFKEWEGQAAGAPEALKRWLAQDRPIALVGPLLSKEVNRAAPVAEAAGLALITPGATATTLTSLGKSVIRNASTGRAQCQALVQHARSRMHLSSFAILFPKTPRSEEWAKCFSDQVKAGGGEILHSASYPPGETDFADPIRHIKSIEAGLDAIFMPGDARTVGLLIPQLTFHGVVGVALLGTNDWNHPQFLKLAGRHAEGALFADGFFPGSPDAAVRQFVEQYQAKYQQMPDILAAQAYDAARLILTAIENGAVTPQEVRAALLSTTQFSGASGQILEIRNGEAVKQPLIIEVRRGRFVQAQ